MWRNWNPRKLLVGLRNGAATQEKYLVVSHKTDYATTVHPSNCSLGYFPHNQ